MGSSQQIVLSLMGVPALRLNGERQHVPLSRQTRDVFHLLCGHANTAVRRDWVAEEVWTGVDPMRAASSLNTAVWRIKKVLKPYAGMQIRSVDGLLKLEVRAPAVVDIECLDEAVERSDTTPEDAPLEEATHDALLEAVRLCNGEFMDGVSPHWVLPLREKYHSRRVRALIALMRDCERAKRFDEALDHGRDILEAEPFRETTQRDVIRLYALNGQRARAIQQYSALKQMLAREMGIAPMPETRKLMQDLFKLDERDLPEIRDPGTYAAGRHAAMRLY